MSIFYFFPCFLCVYDLPILSYTTVILSEYFDFIQGVDTSAASTKLTMTVYQKQGGNQQELYKCLLFKVVHEYIININIDNIPLDLHLPSFYSFPLILAKNNSGNNSQ